MTKKKIWLLSLLPLIVSCSGKTSEDKGSEKANDDIVDYSPDKTPSGDAFDFDGNYTPPELNIDGVDDDAQYQNASPELTFGSKNQASVKLYRGEEALFCFFKVQDIDLETVGNNNGDDVTKGDSVEIYFDFKNDKSSKPQSDDIQINIGAHGKTRIFVGSSGTWGNWNGLLDYEVKLDGTLNNDKDVDNGYTVELMIPYSQVGIDKTSTFGVALGCVARGKDSTHDTLPYTWGGFTYEGNFIDPQNPSLYVVYKGNKFYSHDAVPVDNLTISGTVKDQTGNVLPNTKVKIDDTEVTTDESGKYTLSDINSENDITLQIEKDGYQSYSETITSSEIRTAKNGKLEKNIVLFDNSKTVEVTLKGKVMNPSHGAISSANVAINSSTALSSDDGTFSIKTELKPEMNLIITKDGFKDSTTKLDILSLIGKDTVDLEEVALYSNPSHVSFGGSRGIAKVEADVYRGFDGIHFDFTSSQNMANGDHVELFLDTKTSFHGRDTTDYRIDFKADNGIAIVNFGDGSNNIVSTSGITNDTYLEKTTYHMDTMIPYSFLSVDSDEIIGFSLGVWSQSLSDWDGFSYEGNGFAPYVAPEYTDQYLRLDMDNNLYRASSNEVSACKVTGVVVDSSLTPLSSATVNGSKVNSDGSFTLLLLKEATTITITCNGYSDKTITLSETDLSASSYSLGNIILIKSVVRVEGVVTDESGAYLSGVTVSISPDEKTAVTDANGAYTIDEISTGSNITITFTKDGYTTETKKISAMQLKKKAESGESVIYDTVMKKA